MVKISELRMREVVNITDGRRLGPIKDIDIDLDEGRITAIVLPFPGARFIGLFNRENEIVIPWDKIIRIGVDVILVELTVPPEDRPGYLQGRGRY
ncbi:MAG: YlmC/YmxH family sporulation protein [Desulfocucumaceae bacterium]